MSNMSLRVFTQACAYEKQASPKEKDKASSIQCIERYGQNVYTGSQDSTVQHLILPGSTSGNLNLSGGRTREGRVRKLGSGGLVAQLRVVPLFNHLLVLWDGSVSALNMFSLDPVQTLKKIQHVSLFDMCKSKLEAPSRSACVEMVTSSSRRKLVRIHVVRVDRWDVVKEVPLAQEPVALVVDGSCLCLATSDRYLLYDYETESSMELFPRNHNRQNVIATTAGSGEFLLHGPGSLGMFVMKTGMSQRPPLQWPELVLSAEVCYPYVLVLQPHVLSVYSVLDQRLKQTVSLDAARGLVSATDGALVFTQRQILAFSLVPLEEQIQTLIGDQRLEEALLLLGGIQSRLPLDSYKELHKLITCLAGFARFYQEAFSEARDLFIEAELDPREIIGLYPDMESCLGEAFHTQLAQVVKHKDLQLLRQADGATFHRYLGFLGDFLQAVRGMEQGRKCSQEVDCALLALYAEQGHNNEYLESLVTSPNACRLDYCAPLLRQHNRFFALGLLYQNHGQQTDAIQMWVKIADGDHDGASCSDVYGHIVRTLSQLKDRDVVWMFADWALQRNQETGVQIFTKRPEDRDTLAAEDIIPYLSKYPLALLLYLEFLIHELKSEEQGHHNLLALAYVTQILQSRHKEGEAGSETAVTREKLQDLLWESVFYDIPTVYERMKSTDLLIEKAILLGKAGEHYQALQVLVHEARDPRAAEAYCHRAAEGRGGELRQTLLFALLDAYLSCKDLACAAADLLNDNPQVFTPERVIQLLPEHWSIRLVSRFLLGSLRETFHQRRMRGLQRGLAQAELLRYKVAQTQTSRVMLSMDKDQVCMACQRDIAVPQFIRNLKGELIHIDCISSEESTRD